RTIAEVAADAEPVEMRRALREIASVAAEMQDTIATLLTIARANSGLLGVAKSEVDLGTYLREVCTRRSQYAAPSAAPLMCEADDDVLVETDLAAIASVLKNLIDNALAYTPHGGRILASVRATPAGAQVCVRNHVVDFTQSDLSNMFEPFWRKRGTFVAGSHSGLGLALVRALCEVLNAQVRAELLPGSELAVYVDLPRRLLGSDDPASDEPSEGPPSRALPSARAEAIAGA
ncbi:MAG: HAMP domain-containing histidine kinase, partial [Phycisphaerales bacterium]|nr:HAMP domain-containing histidine kinase [Phycisphaerales bacterium]